MSIIIGVQGKQSSSGQQEIAHMELRIYNSTPSNDLGISIDHPEGGKAFQLSWGEFLDLHYRMSKQIDYLKPIAPLEFSTEMLSDHMLTFGTTGTGHKIGKDIILRKSPVFSFKLFTNLSIQGIALMLSEMQILIFILLLGTLCSGINKLFYPLLMAQAQSGGTAPGMSYDALLLVTLLLLLLASAISFVAAVWITYKFKKPEEVAANE